MMSHSEAPLRAARATAHAHGLLTDRTEILQDGHTLVVRLSESLVARIVVDHDHVRPGTTWFKRENDLAQFLTNAGAPVIPLHPQLPAGPHERDGYTHSFWLYVERMPGEPDPTEIGRVLYHCHDILCHYSQRLPSLAVLTESQSLISTLEKKKAFPSSTLDLLQQRLNTSLTGLASFSAQTLHGDAHPGNLMLTTRGLLLTDWEDTFHGPIEWDLASMIWNPLILEQNHTWVKKLLHAYQEHGGIIREEALHQSLIARAVAMCVWYPILYPQPDTSRQAKLQQRLNWLQNPHTEKIISQVT